METDRFWAYVIEITDCIDICELSGKQLRDYLAAMMAELVDIQCAECKDCEQTILYHGAGIWVDETDGDACGDNGTHSPSLESLRKH